MGILRTDKISGLETPTAAVTGSVYFDGSDDSLTLPDSCGFDSSVSYTVEMWVKDVEVPSGSSPFFTFGASGATNQTFNIDYTSAGNLRLDYYSNAIDFPVELNDGNWHHIAATYDGTTRRIFADGYLGASDTTTNGAYVADNVRVGRMNWISRFAKCYISNLRVVTGTALYTSDFTVPTHALEVIDGTILLCCNNKDNAAAIDHANIGVSKSITVNGGAAVSTLSPGLTRDFTYGTEFKGVTTFDTQGYFVPPSGTTEQRGRGRGLIAGGTNGGGWGTKTNSITYIQISSSGNAQDFGDLSTLRSKPQSVSSSTRAIFGGGSEGASSADAVNTIEYVTIASEGNAVDFGTTLTDLRRPAGGVANNTRGLFAGGRISPANKSEIDHLIFATLGNVTDFGDLSVSGLPNQGSSNSTRGVYMGGGWGAQIDYVTIASTGSGADFGDIQNNRSSGAGASSSTRALLGGGSATENTITYITISTLGNDQDFGDLTVGRRILSGTSNGIRGIFAGGYNPDRNTIDYITISSTGDAKDFGDLIRAEREPNACSDSHGGIS